MLLIGGLCLTADFDQMWSKLCPLLLCHAADFDQNPKCAPCWMTLSHCGLCSNVVQNVPLVGGLCLSAVGGLVEK
jgi:hypothetical protein